MAFWYCAHLIWSSCEYFLAASVAVWAMEPKLFSLSSSSGMSLRFLISTSIGILILAAIGNLHDDYQSSFLSSRSLLCLKAHDWYLFFSLSTISHISITVDRS